MLIPDHFEVKEKLFTATGMSMKLLVNKKKIGEIKSTYIFTGRQYELINTEQDLIGLARKYATPEGTVFEIFDELNYKLGSVHRKVVRRSPGNLEEQYTIRNSMGEIVAQTQLLPEVRSQVDIYDSQNVAVANIHQDSSRLWSINCPGAFDRRLFVFLPLFVSSELSIKCL